MFRQTGSAVDVQAQQEDEPQYLPQSAMTSQGIHAAAAGSGGWRPWRIDADGEQWFERVNGIEATPRVIADDDDDDEWIPEYVRDGLRLLAQSEEDDYVPPADAKEASEQYRLRQAARKWQQQFEALRSTDSDDGNIGN